LPADEFASMPAAATRREFGTNGRLHSSEALAMYRFFCLLF
jgi:hypothetical protein